MRGSNVANPVRSESIKWFLDSPGSIYKYSFIIFKRLHVIVNNLFTRLYNMKLTTTWTKQLKCCCLEISEIKTMKFIKCLTAWFQIRKTLQLLLKISRRTELDNLYRERNESFYNNESLTTIWQLTSV